MKNLFTIVLLLIVGSTFSQAPTLSLINSYSLTPNSVDTIGAFSRIYYHTPRNKFYVIYAARPANSGLPSGQLTNFAWREYDANMNFTGNKGTLPSQTGAGDFAMVMVDSTYYHITLASPTANYKITKYDDNFTVLSSKTITLNACSSNIDQELNYTNNKLIIGAMYESNICPPVNPPSPTMTPQSEILQYDLNLNALSSTTILSQNKVTWGASMIFNAGNYYEITMDNFNNRDLYAYKYDANFNYVNKTLLHSDGQWSQGVLWNNGYYYVAHHTGEHNRGNVLIGIYDNNWTLQNTTTVTAFAVQCNTCGTSYNANRPFLMLKGNYLYVSYDIEKYTNWVNAKDWQAGVKIYQINTPPNHVSELNQDTEVNIFPNPSNGIFYISTSDKIKTSYKIENIYGQLILEGDEKVIDISSQANGVYFYTVYNNEGIPIKKGQLLNNK